MKPYLKFVLTAFVSFSVLLLLGFAIQYFFNIKLYAPLIAGSMVPLAILWNKKRNTPTKQ